MKFFLLILLSFFSSFVYAQDISLYSQFNGRVDFTMIGNTLNPSENEANTFPCTILTSSSTTLNLDSNDYIEAAYLYWAGSGSGDFDVSLNGTNLTSQRDFTTNWYQYGFFSAFTDVTNLVRSTGNGVYTLADLDLNTAIQPYCERGINFGGWAIIIVYSNPSLPINQINVYDGMQSVVPNSVTIELQTLNVIDNTDAKIGFLAWEGDSALAVSESLTFNGNVIGNPPLNPYNNAFNGTNSFTGETDLYNMDLDVYDIENFISIGDTSAIIELHSGQDFVMINAVVTKLNSQLPDATVQINNYQVVDCNDRDFSVNFTVFNLPDATDTYPANTPISLYAFDGTTYFYLGTHYNQFDIEIGNFEHQDHFISTLPDNVPNDFVLVITVDDLNGNSTVSELNESNNITQMQISLPQIPVANNIAQQFACEQEPNITDGIADFDTSEIQQIILGNNQQNMEIFYFDSFGNSLSSPLPNPFTSNTQTIEVFIQNPANTDCNTSTTIDFTVVSLPEFEVNDDLLCYQSFPTTTIVNIENPLDNYNYQWYNSDFELIGNNADSLEISSAGSYSVTATSIIYNCSTTKEFVITNEEITFSKPPNILLCDEGFDSALFNLDEITDQVSTNIDYEISFFAALNDLHQNVNELSSNYFNTSNPQNIFIKVTNLNNNCYNFTNTNLLVEKCLPIVPQLFTPNNNENNLFTIRGLRNIFIDFDLEIYNRYGSLIYKGDNSTLDWDGTYHGENLPSATYFYILKLNDDYFGSMKGWVYLLN